MGKRRAAVLIAVHVAIGLHILHWLIAGRTVSPVEPSEAMYTLEQGLVNAGFIFFIVAILSTLLFGRFFCGWGCHIVALQDLCGWFMKKLGVRPRPFRSRLLVFVPLALALYMFVWPTFKRLAIVPFFEQAGWDAALAFLGAPPPFPGFREHLVKTDFWETFPSVAVAIPFLLICGFATVYFLGAKGFCPYGCPYGGFFAPAEQVAPVRIKVDKSKCEQCGHCTAVCTSNVRVHEEIREYGMVVDPGCMKCMDCVSVCPNDALSLGLAKPALAKGKPETKSPRRKHDLTWPEEIAIAGVFVLSFFAFRGLYGAIPMLLAGGAAACVAFLAWKLLRLAKDPNVRIIGAQLKRAGRIKPAGVVFVSIAVATLAITAHSFFIRTQRWLGDWADVHVAVPERVAFSRNADELIPQRMRDLAGEALSHYRLASSWQDGGVGLASTPAMDVRRAWLHLVRGERGQAESLLRRIVQKAGPQDQLCSNLARVIRLRQGRNQAVEYLQDLIAEHPRFHQSRQTLAAMLIETGEPQQALDLHLAALELPHLDAFVEAKMRAQTGSLLLQLRRMDEAVSQLRQAAQLNPKNADIFNDLAVALFMQGRIEEAIERMRRSAELAPNDAATWLKLAQMLQRAGRAAEARRAYQQAARIDPSLVNRPQRTPSN